MGKRSGYDREANEVAIKFFKIKLKLYFSAPLLNLVNLKVNEKVFFEIT